MFAHPADGFATDRTPGDERSRVPRRGGGGVPLVAGGDPAPSSGAARIREQAGIPATVEFYRAMLGARSRGRPTRAEQAAPGTPPPTMGKLDAYRAKRDFSKTAEPSGDDGRRGRCRGAPSGDARERAARRGAPRFVIQQHAASSNHFDLRLAVDGVLKSWAVPKGPSTDPREKRLAVQVEDHPLDYADFEGRIAEGYGAGTVIVWDHGTFEPLTEGDPGEALEKGHLSFWIDRQKLRGGYTLQRTRGGEKPQWLLIKRCDEGADARRNPVSTQPESVMSGRTVDEAGD